MPEMLNPYSSIGQSFKTAEGNTAIILSYHHGYFVGVVESDDCGGTRRAEPGQGIVPAQPLACRWNADGYELGYCEGPLSGAPRTYNDLIPRGYEFRESFAKLDPQLKQACALIVRGSEGKKIAGIRALRSITGAGLVEAKAWLQTVIPEAFNTDKDLKYV